MQQLENSIQHNYFITNNVRLHYVRQGEGKLMLFLHGFPEFWYSWRYQIPEFAQDYQVIAVDLRGYNDSDKPQGIKNYTVEEIEQDILGLIEGLGYENCILVGHDWGGGIAWSFAHHYPDKIEKLIVMNCPHPAKFAQALQKSPQQILKSAYMAFFQLPLLPELLFQWNDYQLLADAFRNTTFDKNVFMSEDLEHYKNAAAKRGALTAMLNYYRALPQSLSQESNWQPLAMPTLLIWGKDDPFLGQELNDNLEAYVRNLQVKYIDHCSHWVQQEKPELVNQVMREFLLSN
jgi:pimeloyl-ACP methyl ester carboxylesterase